ncbi:aminomethyltransferase family protein [Rhizobium leguminosarum]|uniref:aminomethyltransferase family protein n=1 Tax=Rhizobium leguminosarum TaxID=384 RepID=UPI001441DC89|nr:aminomethyltransferase family protein [Rhizobium leguminosarum]MBY5868676.1 aminomethyl transferase family protein [Rhizobium leguminosarum]NKM08751.1 aminomethyl transferase family protein [Rhizobium leguminosarum bv. viciae]
MTAKRTPLYHAFKARNAEMAEKAHFLTANVFTDAKSEHEAVRNAAGLFEIFGQFLVEVAGAKAETFLNETFVADMSKVAPGRGIYGGILNENGGFIDDVITYRPAPDTFWVVPAPHRVEKVEAYLKECGKPYGVHVVSLGYRYVSLSLQGPQSRACLERVTSEDVSGQALPGFGLVKATVAGVDDVIVTRTGFTGELGYELWVPTEHIESFYDALLEAGKPLGLVPCGAGSMGSLRIEKRYPIWGRDISEDTTPVEAGLGWTVKPKAASYPGKAVVERQKQDGVERMLVLLELPVGSVLPAIGTVVKLGGDAIGKVTSAAHGHTVGHGLALAYVQIACAGDGQGLTLEDGTGVTVRRTAVYDPKSVRSRA